jgi:hypothetical protein
VLERHRQQPAGDVIAVGAVVVAADSDPMPLQIADADLWGCPVLTDRAGGSVRLPA